MATPSIRLSGDKEEAANWIRRGRTELERLRSWILSAEVPTSTRTIEFNDDVTCTVTIAMGIERIEIYARPPEEVSEEEEEDVVEEEHFKCYPGFMVYRDTNGYKWNPDAEPPAYEKVSDVGELIAHDGTKWTKADTDYKSGGTMAWYHLKDNLGKYFRGNEYKRCNLVSWNGLPWGNGGWGSGAFRTNQFYFHGQWYNAGNNSFVIGACILPGSQSEGKDYFHVLTANNWSYSSPLTSTWHGHSYTLKRAPVKLPPESNLLSWETIKFWDETNGVDFYGEWSAAVSTIGNGCSAPNLGAYINAKGVASMTVTEIIGQSYTSDPPPGTYRTGNGVSGNLYGSPLPFYPTGYGQENIFIQNGRRRACISFDLDMRDGKITNKVDNTKPAIQPWSYRRSRHVSDKPVLGLGVLPSQHMYCGPEGGSGSEQSDLVNFNLPADNGRYKKWAKQGHQERGTPAAGASAHENYGGTEAMIGIIGGCDALYTYHMKMSPYRNEATGEGTSERKKWTKSNANPDGFDALPVWSYSTSRGGAVSDFNGDFVVKKDGSPHFELRLHENRIDTGGTHGTTLTWTPQPSPFAGASGPFYTWGSVNEYKTVTVRGNNATAFCTQRAVLFYHPMINKALFTERQVNTYSPHSGSTQVSGTVWLKWGTQDDAETLGQWSGLSDPSSSGQGLHFMLQSSWWNGGTNISGANHCRGEANPGPTLDSEAWGLDARFGFWAQDNLCQDGSGYQPYWRPGYNGGTEGGGLGPNPSDAWINSLDSHDIERDNSNGTDTDFYDRVCYAVHHESPAAEGEQPAYIFYLPKLVMKSLTPENMLTGDFSGVDPGPFAMNDEFDEETPDYWYFSNCISLEKLKKVAGRDTDYPIDFGVV